MGEPFAVDIDASSLPQGHVRLFVTGYVRNSSETVSAQIDFEHRLGPAGR
jgi:hypothetical protein